MNTSPEIPARMASLYGVLVAAVAVLGGAGLLFGITTLTRIAALSVLLGPVVALATISAVRRDGMLAAFGAGTVVVVLIGIVLAL